MTITIEISEEDAACIWANAWKMQGDVTVIATLLLQKEAANYRRAFPRSIATALAEYRACRELNPDDQTKS